MIRLARLLLVALLAGASLSACSDQGTGDKGYISADGLITSVPAAERVKPGPVSGQTLGGQTWTLADHRGKPVVVNVWASWCPPCRAEADDVAEAAKQLGADAVFIGINIRDPRKADAHAFERTHKTPYPSVYDPAGERLLAFHGTLPPNALPSTLVIDADGKVAAIVLGQVPTAKTLVDLVHDVEQGR